VRIDAAQSGRNKNTTATGFVAAERGVAVIESVFVLMILSMPLFGGLELSRAYSLKQSLDTGTYQAARDLALNPHDAQTLLSDSAISPANPARSLIYNELVRNIGAADAASFKIEQLCDDTVAEPNCKTVSMGFQQPFRIKASVKLNLGASTVPFVGGLVDHQLMSVAHGQAVEQYPSSSYQQPTTPGAARSSVRTRFRAGSCDRDGSRSTRWRPAQRSRFSTTFCVGTQPNAIDGQ
jgi:Flp pilus assembly protein TadG